MSTAERLALLRESERRNDESIKAFTGRNLKWQIGGIGLPAVVVYAESFDQALETARSIDPGYNGGFVLEDRIAAG